MIASSGIFGIGQEGQGAWRHFKRPATEAALAGSTIATPTLAQGVTEVSFFYPIAVGGPITKIIDGYAADFEKASPEKSSMDR